MARLEQGKGTRKKVVDITQAGAMLCLHESDAAGHRLPGYRAFASPDEAAAVLIDEIRSRLAEGMSPADEQARTIAQDVARSTSSRPPALPVRCDLAINNEATGLVVTRRQMAGRILEDGSKAWRSAVSKGDLLPLALMQDDPFIIRIVAGEPLTDQENEEWVSRVDWHLNVADGSLCVTGGSIFSTEGYDADDPSYEQYVGQVQLPKGHYRAALYSQAHGVNGSVPMDHVVDFLLHLEPVDAPVKHGLSELPDDGWFAGTENARKPAPAARGLIPNEVVRRQRPSSGTWTFVHDAFRNLRDVELAPIGGGSVTLPLEQLARLARLTWFCSRFTMYEFRLTAPAGKSVDLSGDWPDGVVATEEQGVGRILFNADLHPNAILTLLPRIGERIKTMEPGTELEMCTAPQENMPGSERGAGLIWMRGTVTDGALQLTHAYPVVDASTLQAALSLAGEVETAPGIEVALAGVAVFDERFGKVWPVAAVLGGAG